MKANFAPAFALGLLSFALFRAAYLRHKSAPSRLGLIVLAIGLAVPAVLFTSNYLLCLPYADWFLEVHSWRGAEIASGLVGALLGVMFASSRLRPGRLNRPILIVSTGLATALLVAPFAKQLFIGLDPRERLTDRWEDGVCLQSGGYTCVPACCATAIRRLGGRATEPELARAFGTTNTGTEIWYVRRALRKKGYEPRFLHLRSVKSAPINSIVGVTIGSIHHVVVVLAKDSREVTVGEPLMGRRTYTWKRFIERYKPGGFCMVIRG